MLRMKQQRDPIGPHKQNTTFPAISPALAISDSSAVSLRMRSSLKFKLSVVTILSNQLKQDLYRTL